MPRVELQTRPGAGDKGVIVLTLPEGPPDAQQCPGGCYPIVVGVHGGGWEHGDRRSYDWCWGRLRAGLGQVAYVQASHRPASQAAHPGPYEDLVHVLKWLHEHAEEHRLDRGRCALFGCSSGGHLVSLLATRATRATGTRKLAGAGGGEAGNPEVGSLDPLAGRIPAIRAAVAFAGIHDLMALHVHTHDGGAGSATTAPAGQRQLGLSYVGPPILEQPLLALMGGGVAQQLDAYRSASPVDQVHPGTPPMLLIHGTEDETVPIAQSRRMCAALSGAGCAPTLIEVAGCPHFAMNGPESRPEQCAPRLGEYREGMPKRFVHEEAVMEFFRRHLRFPNVNDLRTEGTDTYDLGHTPALVDGTYDLGRAPGKDT